MIDNIKPTQAPKVLAKDDPERNWRKARHKGGTGSSYLLGRMIFKHPEVIEQWKSAGYDCSIHQLAIRAGILPDIAPEDRALENLMTAWKRADVETREVFLALIEDWEETPDRRHGPRAIISEGAPDVLVKLRARMPMSDLAKALGVSRETVRRWCTGKVQPQPEHLASMQAIAEEDGH